LKIGGGFVFHLALIKFLLFDFPLEPADYSFLIDILFNYFSLLLDPLLQTLILVLQQENCSIKLLVANHF